jgi:hypothetical protein
MVLPRMPSAAVVGRHVRRRLGRGQLARSPAPAFFTDGVESAQIPVTAKDLAERIGEEQAPILTPLESGAEWPSDLLKLHRAVLNTA